MENKKGISRKIIIISFCIVILILGIIGGAFYIQKSQPVDVIEETLPGGSVSLTYTDEENLFVIEKAIPTSDVVGTVSDAAELYFDFTVTTDMDEASLIKYSVLLVKDESVSTAINENIKVYLEKQVDGTYKKVGDPKLFENNYKDEQIGNTIMKVHEQKKRESGSDNYRLRIWLSDTAVLDSKDNQNFGVKVAVVGTAE